MQLSPLSKKRFNRPGPTSILLLQFLLLPLFSCNGDKVPDCIQNAGELVREELVLEPFDKITVYELVRVVIRHGAEQKVEVETGRFLRDEVSASVVNGRLELRNNNRCNLFREYGLTTFYITVPELSEIRSSTGFPILSEGVLPFERLSLISESFVNPETETTDGSFDLNLEVESLSVVANGIAYFKLQGTASRMQLTVAAGDSRIEAENLLARQVSVNHRGSNDMLVYPLESLEGVIRGTGDVVSFHRPDTVQVEILYRGRLIYRE